MNRLLPFALALVAATMCFTACGGDSGSGASDEISVNSSDDEGLDAASSTSVTAGEAKESKKSSSSKGSSAKSSDGASSADVTLSSSQGRLSSSSEAEGSSSSVAASSSSEVRSPCFIENAITTKHYKDGDKEYICKNGYLEPFVRSSSSAGSSSSYYNMDSLFSSKVSYGEFTDPRDGQTYRTINIYHNTEGVDSIEVFAQNLNYGKQVKLGTLDFDDNVVEKFCYNDDPWYCDNGFGGLYSWSETLGLPKACDSVLTGSTPACPDSVVRGSNCLRIQGICPEGWHVMNEWDWTSVKRDHETGGFLVSKVTRGNNLNGFSALLGGGGFYDKDGLRFDHIKEESCFWLPRESVENGGGFVSVSILKLRLSGQFYVKSYGLSVRCVKDFEADYLI